MKINQIVESATTAGSIATVASPLGATHLRTQKPPKAPKVVKGKKYANTLSEGEIKRIATDMDELSDAAFKKKYGKTKQEMRASLKEEKIAEADLIVVPGMRKSKDKSFIPHKEDRRDHEVEMARSDLYAAAKDAMRIFKLLKDRSEDDGIMGWQQSYITLASDYLNSVADSLEYQMNMYEMTGGVIAGGMSNFEEGLEDEPPPEKGSLEYRALKRMKGPTQEDALEALVIEIGLDRFKRENKLYREYIPALMHHYKKQGVAEEQLDELKKSTINDYLSKSSAAVRGGRQEVAKKVPSWKVAAGKVNPNSELSKYAKIKATDQSMQATAEGRYYDPMGDERREQDAMDQERRDFKRKEMEYELRNEPKNNYAVHIDGRSWKVFGDKAHAEAVARKLRMKGKKAEVKITGAPVSEAKAHKCPECGGEMVSEELMNEKKDACYYKVKSRYKVWPSAYASGALVKCRKKGASNWGNKSKK